MLLLLLLLLAFDDTFDGQIGQTAETRTHQIVRISRQSSKMMLLLLLIRLLLLIVGIARKTGLIDHGRSETFATLCLTRFVNSFVDFQIAHGDYEQVQQEKSEQDELIVRVEA